MTTQPSSPIVADRSRSDTAALVPTATPPTEHVTTAEIAEFLRHLARFRSPAVGGDPADHAALLARKAELFARIADQQAHTSTATTTPMAPEGRTP